MHVCVSFLKWMSELIKGVHMQSFHKREEALLKTLCTYGKIINEGLRSKLNTFCIDLCCLL